MMTGDIEREDVGLEINFTMRTIYRQHQCRKKFFPAMQK
jgi:hypothetical protein